MKEIGDRVRQLKADGAPQNEIDVAVNELKAKKKALGDAVGSVFTILH